MLCGRELTEKKNSGDRRLHQQRLIEEEYDQDHKRWRIDLHVEAVHGTSQIPLWLRYRNAKGEDPMSGINMNFWDALRFYFAL